jgi:cold shock CspA family protein
VQTTGLKDGDGSVGDGDKVTFRIEFDDRKGKDRCVDVVSEGGGSGGGRRGGGRDRSRSRGRGGGGRSRSRSRGRGGGGRGGGGGPGTGEMIRWNAEKGFGFIKPDKGDEDLFCHVSALLDGDGSVRDGDRVKFVVQYDERKGKDRAVDVAVEGGGSKRGGGRGRDDSRSPPPRKRERDDSRRRR